MILRWDIKDIRVYVKLLMIKVTINYENGFHHLQLQLFHFWINYKWIHQLSDHFELPATLISYSDLLPLNDNSMGILGPAVYQHAKSMDMSCIPVGKYSEL